MTWEDKVTLNPTLEKIVSEVPRCPMCGHEGYVVLPKVLPKGVILQSVNCAKCKADVLEVFWTLIAGIR